MLSAGMKSMNIIENTVKHVNRCPMTVSLTIILLLFIHKIFTDEEEKDNILSTM